MGTISFHRMPPELFMGFELSPRSDAKIASPEKALFDLFYLAPGRSRVFSYQPELTIPRRFQWQRLKAYTKLVKSAARSAYIAERIRSEISVSGCTEVTQKRQAFPWLRKRLTGRGVCR